MASIVDVLEAVGELLPPGTQYEIGEELVGSNAVRPQSVVFALGQDAYQAPRQRPGAKSIRTRVATVQAMIWAVGTEKTARADMRAVEALLDALLVAVERTVGGSFDVGGGQWIGATPNQKGRAYSLALSFDLPVVLPETRTIITATQTQQTLGGA